MTSMERFELQDQWTELKDAEQLCTELTDAVDGNLYDIEIQGYSNKEAAQVIKAVGEAFSHRAQQLSDQIERLRNLTMDNFRNRRITNAANRL